MASYRDPRERRPFCSTVTTMSSPPATSRAGSGKASSASRSCRRISSTGARSSRAWSATRRWTTWSWSRGGADNKGQHLSNILGAMDAVRAGTACWKVKIILDGEEEHGSPNLEAIARAHRAKLAADVLIGSDGPKQKNAPTLVMGVRGLLTVNIVADNGQATSVHSGNYGNIVPNPVLPLARLIGDI